MSIKLIRQADQDDNPEAWLAAVVRSEQTILDTNYNSKLDDYTTACKFWITENDQNQTIGKPITPKPTPPRKQIAYAAENRVWKQYTAEADPDLPVPQLPPYTPPNNKGVGFGSGAGANTDMQNALLQTILTEVLAIKASLLKPA